MMKAAAYSPRRSIRSESVGASCTSLTYCRRSAAAQFVPMRYDQVFPSTLASEARNIVSQAPMTVRNHAAQVPDPYRPLILAIPIGSGAVAEAGMYRNVSLLVVIMFCAFEDGSFCIRGSGMVVMLLTRFMGPLVIGRASDVEVATTTPTCPRTR